MGIGIPAEEGDGPASAKGKAADSWKAFRENPDEDSFALFYDQTRGFIFAICVRMLGDEDEAFDVMQTVYSRLLLLASDPDQSDTPIDDQIYRIAVQEADVVRSRKRRRRAKDAGPEALDTLTDRNPGADAITHRRHLQSVVAETLGELPDPLRLPLQLHYVQGLTHDQVAEQLAVSRSAASRLIYKALAELEDRLRQKGITETVIALLVGFGLSRLWLEPSRTWSAPEMYRRARDLASAPGAPSAPAPGLSGLTGKWGLTKVFGAGMLVLGTLLTFLVLPHQTSPSQAPVVPVAPSSGPSASSVSSTPTEKKSGSDTPASGRRDAAGTGRFAGRTVALTGGAPLSGVRVRFETPDGQSSELSTGGGGQFLSPPLKAGPYTVRFEPPVPYAPQFSRVMLNARSGYDFGDVLIRRLATLRGRVLREGAGPLGGQVVELRISYEPNSRPRAVTNPDGTFEFHNLCYDNYGMTLNDNQNIAYYRALMPDGEDRDIEIILGDGQLHGTVLRAGKPFPWASVHLVREYNGDEFSMGRNTRETGTFAVVDLKPGRYRVEITPSRDEALAKQKLITSVDILGTGSQFLDFTLPSGRLVGSIRTAAGQLVPHASVQVTSDKTTNGSQMAEINVETSATAAGEFVLEGLPPGHYHAVATGPNGQSDVVQSIEVPFEGDSAPVEFRLKEGSGARVIARALDRDTGQRVDGAWCDLATPAGTLRWPREETPDGALVLRSVPPGTYSAEISAFGYTAARFHLNLSDRETTELVAVLQEAGAVRWRLLTPDGQRATSVSCLLEPVAREGQAPVSPAQVRFGTTDQDGLWLVRALPPGRYTLSAEKNGAYLVQDVQVHAHNITDMRSWLKPPAGDLPSSSTVTVAP